MNLCRMFSRRTNPAAIPEQLTEPIKFVPRIRYMRSSFLMHTGLLSAICSSGRPATTYPEETNAHTFTAMTNGGEEQTLASSKGKVLLFVNTASRCGLTSQYTGLQNLQERLEIKFSVMAFPSNDFMGRAWHGCRDR